MMHDQSLSAYMDAKWKVKKIASNPKLSLRQKFNLTRAELNSLRSVAKPDSKKLGIKGRIYALLLGNQMTTAILALEFALLCNVKELIPATAVNWLKYRIFRSNELSKFQRKGPTAFIFMVPDLGNLGDLAIGLAQKSFLEKNLQGYSVVEIRHGTTYQSAREIFKQATADDIIFLTGGGNMGTIYKDAELQRRFLIKLFRNNPIYQFPQSVFFEDSTTGKRFHEESMQVYARHPNLTLIARDRQALSRMRASFPRNRVELYPDTVISLSPIISTTARTDQATLSIRRDIESGIDRTIASELETELRSLGLDVIHRDTNTDNLNHALSERENSVQSIWTTYLSSRLVITDRLHGVIFCAITGTPCIAIDNLNGKVRNLIDTWFLDERYITAIDSPSVASIIDRAVFMMSEFPDGARPVDLTRQFTGMVELFNMARKH